MTRGEEGKGERGLEWGRSQEGGKAESETFGRVHEDVH